MTTHVNQSTITPLVRSEYRSNRAADRFMRSALGISGLERRSSPGAHRAFRVAVVVSAVRCLFTYVLVPIMVPILSLSGWVAAPVGMALCVLAGVNGIASMRRFWRSDHRQRWIYTAFIGVVFIILAVALASDLKRLGAVA